MLTSHSPFHDLAFGNRIDQLPNRYRAHFISCRIAMGSQVGLDARKKSAYLTR
jgi:hypothetical protein